MRSSRRSWLLASLALGAFGPLALSGCLAPTLPVPPPEAQIDGPPDADGMVTVKGTASANAEVTVWNPNLDKGTGVVKSAAANGAWEIRIKAQIGDVLEIWQTVGFDRGNSINRTVPAT